MRKGDKWKRLECLAVIVEREKILAFDAAGKPYETGLTQDASRYQLKCECGNEIEVLQAVFEGKRKVWDCGCGLAENDGVTVVMSFSLSVSTRLMIEEFKNQTGFSYSKAVTTLLERGREAWEEDELRDAKKESESRVS